MARLQAAAVVIGHRRPVLAAVLAAVLAPVLAAVLLVLLAAGARAQELVHHAQGVDERVTQVLRFEDPWEESAGDALFEARPRSVETRVVRNSAMHESVQVELLLFGEWGWFHFPYVESEIARGDLVATGSRTERLALDVGGDGRSEILLLERRVSTKVPLSQSGDPMPGARPLYEGHSVTLRVLSRSGGSLVETSLPADPDSPGFAALLLREEGGRVHAALQLMVGDWLFNEERYAEARYRYQVAREWAERQLSGRQLSDLATDMVLLEPDPDRPEFVWITAMLRHAALPPFFRRRP